MHSEYKEMNLLKLSGSNAKLWPGAKGLLDMVSTNPVSIGGDVTF